MPKVRSLKTNVLLNLIGGTVTTVLNLLLVPIQIRLLGPEAYGLISFIAVLQFILGLLDFGLTTTLTREIAADTSQDKQLSHDLIRTALAVFGVISIPVSLLLLFGADWIAGEWLNLEQIPLTYAALSIRIMAFTLIANWVLNLFVSALSGLQRLDIVNILRITTRIGIQVGGIVILIEQRSLLVFVTWIAFSTGISLLSHAYFLKRLLPGLHYRPFISWVVLRRIWRYSLGMNLLTLTNIVYTQADSLLISRMLSLSQLGYYNLAYSLGLGMATLQQFIGGATLPTLAQDYSQKLYSVMMIRFSKYVQSVVYISTLIGLFVMFWGHDFLLVWSGKAAANQSAVALSLLGFGFLLNSLVSTFYVLGQATGSIRHIVNGNIVGLSIHLPILYVLIARYQLGGAAFAWIIINTYFLLFLLRSVAQSLPGLKPGKWLWQNFGCFLLCGAIFPLGRVVAISLNEIGTLSGWILFACCAVIYLLLGFLMLDKSLRQAILRGVIRLRAFSSFYRQ